MERTLQIKISIIIQLAATGYLLFFGALYLAAGSFQSYHALYTGLTWEQLGGYNANLQYLMSVFIRLVGACYMSLGIAFIGIIYLVFWQDNKIAFYCGVPSALLFTIVSDIITVPVLGTTSIGLYVTNIIFLVLIIIAYILAAKELFKK